MSNRIYGFAGRKRSGKGVLCNLLQREHGAIILTVANYLKYLCCDLLNVDINQLNQMKDDGTLFSYRPDERWINIISKRTNIHPMTVRTIITHIEFTSVRQMLQVIGTDLIRRYAPTWHIDQLADDINSYKDKLIVIDDVRFPNEREMIESMGGECFYIVRSHMLDVSNHSSETSLNHHMFAPHHVIINNRIQKELETDFLFHFNNNFLPYVENGCLLCEHPEWQAEATMYMDDSPERQFVLSEILKTPYQTMGVLRFNQAYTHQPQEIDNPLVVENLKIFL